MSNTDSLLAGIRIVDLTSGLAGPVATMLLAEVGADVVKVEGPEGDWVRRDLPAAFATWNRSKRGVVLDVDTAEGRSGLDVLLAGADVVVHGFTSARAQALGLDDASLSVRFPRLVVSAVTGYPGGCADAERSDEELLVQARSGIMDEQLGHRPGPVVLRFPVAGWPTAYLAACGIVVRLLVRRRTGRAGIAHTSLFQGLMAELALVWHRAERPSGLMQAKIPLPRDMAFPAITLFQCADGRWIQTLVGFIENPLVMETIASMGEPYTLVAPGTLPDAAQRDLWRRMFLLRPSTEWIEAFHAGDVPAEAVQELGQVLVDPLTKLNGYAIEVEDPVWGRVTQAAAPFAVQPPPRVRSAAPELDPEASVAAWLAEPAVTDEAGAAYPEAPLAGLKVLDLGMFLAGPFAPMMLADLGAEVIKLEPPDGDRMRPHEMLFVACQRGKRSVALDLSRPEARPALDALVRWADVVHHNLRMPAARALGIDEDSVRAINPRIVYTHVSAYGPRGPRAEWPGYDPIAQAVSGFMVEGGGAGNPPMWTRFGMMDHQAALSSLLPTLLALYRRDITGEGSRVDASLLGGAAMVNSETMVLPDGAVADVPHLDAEQRLIGEGQGIYRTADGWVAVVARGATTVAAMLGAVGSADHASFESAVSSMTTDQAVSALEAAAVPCERVRTNHEQAYFDDAELRARGLTVAYEHPVYGLLEQPGAFWDFGDLRLVLQRPPPILGQHSREVLHDVGIPSDVVDELCATGVLSEPDRVPEEISR